MTTPDLHDRQVSGDAFETALDALAAGDLDELTRSDLLRSLDGRPDGWRRCAIAFLEAQCLREHFLPSARAVPSDQNAVTPARALDPEAPSTQAGRVRWGIREVGLGLAMVVLCGVVGATTGLLTRSALTPEGGSIASQAPPPVPEGPEAGRDGVAMARTDPEGTPDPAKGGAGGAPEALDALVTFPDGRERRVAVPVNVGPEPAGEPAGLAELRKGWAHAGLVVEDSRHLQQVALPDGRTAIVPIGRVRAYPSGRPIQ